MKQEKLKSLRETIMNNKVIDASIKSALFGGADISIISKRPSKKDSFYGDPQYVVTKYSKELSWLIFQLKEIFKDNLDYINKYPFYGRLAEKANKSIELHGENLNQLLLDVLEEAENMNTEME